MYYPSSENKGADQLRGNREADLRLCFRLCRLLVFPWGGSNIDDKKERGKKNDMKINVLILYKIKDILVNEAYAH